MNSTITPEYFWYDMTRAELKAVYKALNNKNREAWEIMRIQTFHFILPHVSKEAIKRLTPQSLIPFTWDKVSAPQEAMCSEDRMEILNRMKTKQATGKVAQI